MPADDPLGLTPEQMREMGRATVELLVELLADPAGDPPLRRASPHEARESIHTPAPAEGLGFERSLARLRDEVLPLKSRTDHPAYFAFIPTNGTFAGALGDFISSALNIICDSWLESAGPSQVELTVLDWFKEWLGYPESAAGVLVSGGSAANLTALGCARESLAGNIRDDLVIYVSDQAHSSIARAARALGFGPEQLRVLPVDEDFRMRTDALEGAIATDREAGRTPLAVCGAAGSTNTGAVDPLAELTSIAHENGAWMHVDAAYGGFAVLSERGSELLAGIEQADSVTLDPHKWLYQPLECGCVLVREGRRLSKAFSISPDYLKDTGDGNREVNFSDLGLQLSRTSRALKVWLSINTFGLDAFRLAVERSLDLARLAQERIEASEELELLCGATLGIVCFRRRFGGGRSELELEKLNRALVADLQAGGEAFLTSTRLRGRYALRLAILNHTTGADDVERVLDWLERAEPARGAAAPLAEAPRTEGSEAGRTLAAGLPEGAPPSTEALGELRLFEGVEPALLERLAATARTRRIAAAEKVTTRWGGGRDFYVIVAGGARAELEGEIVRRMGPEDFFGELAALDWGAGFGYARTATVTADEDTLLLVIPSDTLNLLVRESPPLEARIRAAVRERLPRS